MRRIMSILKVFISQLLEFLNDLILLFPNDINLKTSKKAVLTLQKINPKSLLVNWKYYVTDKYKKQIYEGDVDFFIKKDYEGELDDVEDKGAAMEAIEQLRPALLRIGDKNKQKASKYLINLTKLSEIYVTF